MPQTGQVTDGVLTGGRVYALQVTQKPAATRSGAAIVLWQRGQANGPRRDLSWSIRVPPLVAQVVRTLSRRSPLAAGDGGIFMPAGLAIDDQCRPVVVPDRRRSVTLGGH